MLPGKSKLVRRLKHAFFGAGIILVLINGAARAGDWPLGKWPLVLPSEQYGDIPDGQGMEFFLGKWRQGGSRPQGGPMIVTENKLEIPEARNLSYRYRVIYEASNYILLVARTEPYKSEYPTHFMIFAVQSSGLPATIKDNIRTHLCDWGTWGTFEAFEWSVEKLLETFKKSLCLSIVDIVDGSVSIGWGSYPHIRVGPWDNY
jgi:hypothetical protein